jgi:hypothetical protein
MPRKPKHVEEEEEEDEGLEDLEGDEEEEDLRALEREELPKVEPYKVLGIEKTATADEIKLAYRKAALKNHPGTNISFHLSLLNLQVMLDTIAATWARGWLVLGSHFVCTAANFNFRQSSPRLERRSYHQISRDRLRLRRPLRPHPQKTLRCHRLDR